MLEYLIVFETPWILTAAWKIVKTWLSSDGISKIKFVNKTEILNYVNQDQLLKCLGGEDDFLYAYPPQLFSGVREMKERNNAGNSLALPAKADVFSSISVSLDHQASGSTTEDSPKPNGVIKHHESGENDFSSIEHSFGDRAPTSKVDDKVRRRKFNRSKRNMVENAGPLVTISPANELLFCGPTPCTSEILQVLRVTNTVSSRVAFKIKTTSPENFRVRPSCGPIAPGESVEVQIHLQPGHEMRLFKDKFLILSTVMPDDEKLDAQNMWKSIPPSSIMEQRLRCRFEQTACLSNENSDHDSLGSIGKKPDAGDNLFTIANQFIDFSVKLNDMENKLLLLDKDIRRMFHMIGIILVGLVFTFAMVVLYVWRDPVK